MQTAIVSACEPITWFSVYEHYFFLPLDLATLMLGVLVFGVFVCQMLPGLALLFSMGKSSTRIPLALKLNDFCIILALVEYEAEFD